MNLWEETIEEIEDRGYTLQDVAWVGCDDFTIDLDYYESLARKTDYNPGYGSEEIALDLVIVFKDGTWLSRDSYDGSEWFRYNVCPQKPPVQSKPVRLMNVWSSSLKSMQVLDENDFPIE